MWFNYCYRFFRRWWMHRFTTRLSLELNLQQYHWLLQLYLQPWIHWWRQNLHRYVTLAELCPERKLRRARSSKKLGRQFFEIWQSFMTSFSLSICLSLLSFFFLSFLIFFSSSCSSSYSWCPWKFVDFFYTDVNEYTESTHYCRTHFYCVNAPSSFGCAYNYSRESCQGKKSVSHVFLDIRDI